MSFLFIAAALLTVAVLAALLAPLLGRGATETAAATPVRGDYDLAVYRDQLAEIDRDQEKGLFTPAEAEAARIEIQRRMLAAADSRAAEAPTAAPEAVGAARRLALAVVVIVPLAAVGLYSILGKPGAGDLPLAQRQTAAGEQHDMNRLVEQLRIRLQETPDDIDGWLMLARSYSTMGRFDGAAMAFGQVVTLTGRRPDILAAWGEALIWQAADRVTPQAEALFREALATDPGEPRARFYMALARLQAGDLAGAVRDWTALAQDSPPDAPWMATVTDQIRRATAAMGGGAPIVPVAPVGPSQADVEAATQMSTDDRDAMIRGMVERLAERMRENPGDRDGWLRLGRAYEVLGDTAKAEEALGRARALEGGAPPRP